MQPCRVCEEGLRVVKHFSFRERVLFEQGSIQMLEKE